MVRGGSYTPEDDAALARCWVAISEEHEDQDSAMFWESVAHAYEPQLDSCQRSRSATSLPSRWQTMQRVVQKYLAAERIYYSHPQPSGTTIEEVRHDIMMLYCRRTRKKDRNGVERDGEPLKSLSAVEILRKCPKFYGTVAQSGESTTVRNVDAADDQEFGESVTGNVPPKPAPLANIRSSARPLGVKKALKNRLKRPVQTGYLRLRPRFKNDHCTKRR